MRWILFLLALAILAPAAYAVGVGPVLIGVQDKAGQQQFTVYLINEEPVSKTVTVEKDGSLAQYIGLQSNSAIVDANSVKPFQIIVSLPSSFEGDQAYVRFIEHISNSAGTSLSAFSAIGVRLYISNKTSLSGGGIEISATNSSAYTPVTITLNLNLQQLVEVNPKIIILDENVIIYDKEFGKTAINGAKTFATVWQPELEGVFTAKAEAAPLSSEKEFTVGSPQITPLDAFATEYDNETVVTISAKSNWNKPVDAKMNVQLAGFATTKTVTFENREPKSVAFELGTHLPEDYIITITMSLGAEVTTASFSSKGELLSMSKPAGKNNYFLFGVLIIGLIIVGTFALYKIRTGRNKVYQSSNSASVF